MILDVRFWQGFGFAGCQDFRGKTVLELGCGAGARALEMAAHGAKRVVGLDPHPSTIPEAIVAHSRAPQDLRNRVRFFSGTIDELPPEQFDVIISENTLEHVLDVPGLLAKCRARLNPRGRLYIAFGPPYHAPDGDHGWLRAMLPGYPRFPWPWGHLLFEHFALRRLSKRHGQKITATKEWPYLDLNRHTVAQYERMFADSGMRVIYFRTNRVESMKAKLFAFLARLPWLTKYCTMNMSVVLANE